MLGNDRFAFETPNVIDPGDLPPSRPTREQQENNTSSSNRHSSIGFRSVPISSGPVDSTRSISASSEEEYNQARESAARLLRDIADLDLTPAAPAATVPYDPYDPYDDNDEDDGDYNTRHHSLPVLTTPHKDRFKLKHASSLMKTEAQPLSMSRTVKLSEKGSSSKRLVRKRITHYLMPVAAALCVVLGIGIFVAVIVGLAEIVFVSKRDSKGSDGTDNALAPKINENSVRFVSLVRFLDENGISNANDLTNSTSPQYKAAFWIANEDGEQREISESLSASYDPERVIQRYVLAVFYWATGGAEHWHDNLSFVTAADECAWFLEEAMPQFIAQQYAVGVGCDENLLVRSLFIPNNGLVGTIPSEIRFLSSINLLALPLNQLTGNIPQAFGDFQELLYLNLNYNNISGIIPEFFGDYERIEILGLSNNQLTGNVPGTIATLGTLRTLALDDNNFQGDISFIRHAKSLEYLYLDRNAFTGQLDDSFFLDLPLLREFDVSENRLKGNLNLNFLFNHDYLRVLDLANNNFTGQFPTTIDQNVVLEYFSLRGNQMNGTVTDAITQLTRLAHLDLHGNMFTGIIPNGLGGIKSLSYLFLGENKFDVDVFPPLSQLINLRELSLSNLGIQGPIFNWLRYVYNLQLLDLSHNNFNGSVPAIVWTLPNLEYLLLNDNSLTGVIPQNFSGGQNLKILTLHRNNLTGNADSICKIAANLSAVARDCAVSCTAKCCSSCCKPGDTKYFVDEAAAYMSGLSGSWEFKYKRSSFSFDPDSLEKAELFKIISEDPNGP